MKSSSVSAQEWRILKEAILKSHDKDEPALGDTGERANFARKSIPFKSSPYHPLSYEGTEMPQM